MSSPKPALTWYSVMAVPCVSPQAATRTRESKTPMRGVGLDTTLQRCARAAACVEARRSALMPLMRAAAPARAAPASSGWSRRPRSRPPTPSAAPRRRRGRQRRRHRGCRRRRRPCRPRRCRCSSGGGSWPAACDPAPPGPAAPSRAEPRRRTFLPFDASFRSPRTFFFLRSLCRWSVGLRPLSGPCRAAGEAASSESEEESVAARPWRARCALISCRRRSCRALALGRSQGRGEHGTRWGCSVGRCSCTPRAATRSTGRTGSCSRRRARTRRCTA